MKKPDLRGSRDVGRCLWVAASHPGWAARSRAGVTSARELLTLALSLQCLELAGCCCRSPVAAVQGYPHLQGVGHLCLVFHFSESTGRGYARPCGMHLTPCSQEWGHSQDLTSPQQLHGQPRRPAVPRKVMTQRKTWESAWVKAPAQA